MREQKKELINQISIPQTTTLLEAIKKMDELDKKLLIVTKKDGGYKSILSIGDVQRHLIKYQKFDAKVVDALRKNVKVSSVNDSLQKIKELMLEFRTEFMPVIDETGSLKDVIFWEDLFHESHSLYSGNLNVPVAIMAGGMGTRLKPITNIIPKPLIPLGEKPIIEIIVERFNAMGTKNFYISLNHKAEMIKQYFNQVEHKNYTIDYFEEDKPLGTAGSLFLLKDKVKSTFFVTNCDILVDQNYEDIYNYHKENRNEITLVAALKHYHIPYGTIETDAYGLLKEMKEKPEITFMVNAGMYILEPHLIEEIPANHFFHITHLINCINKRGGRVGVFPVSERSWSDIGEWKEYRSAMKKLGYNSEDVGF